MSFSYSETRIEELLSEFTSPHVREAVELSALPGILDQTDYFIDVGANVGLYTFHAAKHLRRAKILAIEANPYLIPALRKTVENLRGDDASENEYEIVEGAVSDIPGSLEFHVSKFPTLSSIFPHETATAVTVPTLCLDDFYRPSVRTVVKIDVEGAEHRVMRTASRFLTARGARFFVELHGWGDKTIGRYPIHLCWLFVVNGYALRKIGTHYLFQRAAWPKRWGSFLRQCPYLGVKYLVFRYTPGLLPLLRRMRSKT